MSRRRILIDFDLSTMGFDELQRVSSVLVQVEELSKAGLVAMQEIDNKAWRRSTARRKRIDSKDASERRLEPQTLIVLKALMDAGECTATDLAAHCQQKEGSVRARLHLLLARGLVGQIEGGAKPARGKTSKLWKVSDPEAAAAALVQ